MADHPFTLPYIGLGLLDQSSITRNRAQWAAEYRDVDDDPYLAVYVGERQVKLQEFDGGKRVATTVAPTLSRAIGMHGGDAIGGDY